MQTNQRTEPAKGMRDADGDAERQRPSTAALRDRAPATEARPEAHITDWASL